MPTARFRTGPKDDNQPKGILTSVSSVFTGGPGMSDIEANLSSDANGSGRPSRTEASQRLVTDAVRHVTSTCAAHTLHVTFCIYGITPLPPGQALLSVNCVGPVEAESHSSRSLRLWPLVVMTRSLLRPNRIRSLALLHNSPLLERSSSVSATGAVPQLSFTGEVEQPRWRGRHE